MGSIIDEPFFTRPGGETGDVIASGKDKAQRQSDDKEGLARFGGGWRQPSYQRAYMRAARLLLDQARGLNDLDQLGLPIFYLMRHSCELFIKGHLQMLYEVAEMSYEHRPNAQTLANQPCEGARKRLGSEHSLTKLSDDLQDVATTLGFGSFLPGDLADLVRQLSRYELTPEWSRYATSRKVSKPHTEIEVAVPIVELLDRFEGIVKATSTDLKHETTSLGNEVYCEWDSLMTALNK